MSLPLGSCETKKSFLPFQYAAVFWGAHAYQALRLAKDSVATNTQVQARAPPSEHSVDDIWTAFMRFALENSDGRYTIWCKAMSRLVAQNYRLSKEKGLYALKYYIDGGTGDLGKFETDEFKDMTPTEARILHPVVVASAWGLSPLVQQLLERLKNSHDDTRVNEALYWSAQGDFECENKDVLRLLLANGADVNAKEGRYGTALKAAVAKGNLGAVQILLENDAAVDKAIHEVRSERKEM